MKKGIIFFALGALAISVLINLSNNYNKGAKIGGAKLIKDPDEKK